jgi:hypothetical protein
MLLYGYFFSAIDLNLAFINGEPAFHSGTSSELAKSEENL